ncbi:MAG: metallopeptidase TldD-related protein [Planctomycetota bacterium]
MSFFELVEEEVRRFSSGGVSTDGFRISLAESAKAELGVESNRAGSPYRPLTVTDLAGGSFLIRWSDGMVSRGALSRTGRDGIREVLESACEGRYDDPDAAIFAEACEPVDVPLFSDDTAAVAEGRSPEALPDLLAVLTDLKEEHGAEVLDASGRASRARRRVVTSGGFAGEAESTVFGWSFALDSLVWDGHESREVPGADEVGMLARLTAADYEGLREPAGETPRGEMDVLLHPRVAESFFGTFLYPNLSGAAVANGRSRFTADDFREGRRVFREDLGISVRPHVPMSVGAFGFTDEGVCSREFELIDGGRLTTPTLSLKYARRLEMSPASLPAAVEGLHFSLNGEIDREAALAGGEVVLVHSVMGLHTQDAVRGEYSVLAPQGVLYRDGKAMGRVTATLNGSFFEDLSSADLRLVGFPGFAGPGLLVRMTLT